VITTAFFNSGNLGASWRKVDSVLVHSPRPNYPRAARRRRSPTALASGPFRRCRR